jgi:hypothetical protein
MHGAFARRAQTARSSWSQTRVHARVLAGAKRHAVGDPHAVANVPKSQASDGVPTYLESGDPAGRFADYYPAWMDKLAADATLEGSMLDGAVQGPDAIRTVISGVREQYDRQDFTFAGPWRDNGFIEDYTAEVRGRPLGCLHRVTFNADGQTQHIAAHYRPLSSLLFFSRLLRESLAGTPYAEHFLAGDA